MVLPLLFSFGLPALAGTGALGATLAGMSAPVLSGLGAGLGSFLQSGDIGKGVQTGLTAVLGGKLLGGLGGALGGQQTATNALSTSSPMSAVLAAPAKESFLQPVLGDTLTKTMAAPGMMESALIGSSVASALDYKAPDMKKKNDEEIPDPRPKIRVVKKKPDNFQGEHNYFDYYDPDDYVQYARGGGLMSLGQQYSHPMFNMMETHLNTSLQQASSQKVKPFIQEVETMAKERFGPDIFQGQLLPTKGPFDVANLVPLTDSGIALPSIGSNANPMETYTRPLPESNFHLFAQPAPSLMRLEEEILNSNRFLNRGMPNSLMNFGSVLQGFAEGGEVEGMNEKDVILESILAIKGMKSEAEAQMILGKFLSEYGEAALRDLVDSVQSGEYDETVARFAEGEKGMVRGPGDGSGEDDKVPATLDNQQDVLLTEGEFVIRKPTTDALTKEYGGGFLDKINEAEGDAPEVLRKMVG
jgi:hypothetical protein